MVKKWGMGRTSLADEDDDDDDVCEQKSEQETMNP